MGAVMSELPNLSAQKPYALDQLAQLQGKIIQLSKSMVLQRARIERCRQSDLAAARDIYAELSRTQETLVETLAQARLFLMEMEEYALAKVSGQLRQGLAGFALMSTGYKSVYEALSRFASSLPVGQKTNAAVVGRLMNNIKLGYYPTDPDTVNNDVFCKIFALANRCNPQALILVDIYFKTAILRGTIIHFVVAKTASIHAEVDSTVAFCPFKKFKCLLVARSAICTEFILYLTQQRMLFSVPKFREITEFGYGHSLLFFIIRI